MPRLELHVNARAVQVEVDPQTLLIDLLRGPLGLTGTHAGCDTGQCGACTVLLDGVAVKSCSVLALQADGCAVTTIEGLAIGDTLHPLQQAFSDCHGLQCGFCTPGMVMAAAGLLAQTPRPSAAWPTSAPIRPARAWRSRCWSGRGFRRACTTSLSSTCSSPP